SYALIDRGLDASKRFHFPTGAVVQAGYTVLVLCDSQPSQGPWHANFKIDNDGDRIYLQQRTVAGAYVTVDAIEVPPLAADESYSRRGARGPGKIVPATPRASNISDDKIRFRRRSNASGEELVMVFPVTNGVPYTIEWSTAPRGPWMVMSMGMGAE